MIFLIFLGLICTFICLAWIVKFVLGKWYDDNFVVEFVKKAILITLNIAVVIIAITFIWSIVALIQYELG